MCRYRQSGDHGFRSADNDATLEGSVPNCLHQTSESDDHVPNRGLNDYSWFMSTVHASLQSPEVSSHNYFVFCSVEGLECIIISDRDGVQLVEGNLLSVLCLCAIYMLALFEVGVTH